jgi:PAS domain S-box-containing protein
MASEPAQGETDRQAMSDWLFEDSGVLLFTADAEARLRLINPAWTALTGWAQDELVGRRLADLAEAQDRPDLEAFLAGLAHGETGNHAVRLRRRDGAGGWVEGRMRRAPDGRIIGSLRDARHLVAARAEIHEARRLNEMLHEVAGIGTWTYDPAIDRIHWSDDLFKLTGYSQEDLQAPGGFGSMVHPDDGPLLADISRRGVELGENQTFDHRIQHKDGRWLTARATFRTERLADGRSRLHGITQDITELAAARDAAIAGERRIRQLIEAAPFAVAMFDRELRYMVASPRWTAAFSLDRREHVGRKLNAVFPDIPKRLIAAARRAAAGEVVSSPEDRFTDGAGNPHWVRWEARPWLEADGKVGGILAYVDDISAQAQARKDAQANAARLKMALEAGQAGVYEIDHVARTFWASPELRRLAGMRQPSYEDAQQLRFPRFHPDDLAGVRDAFLAIRDGARDSGEAFEARILTAEGGERWVRVFHHLTTDRKGRWLKGVGLVLDCDARKRQELALIEAERAAQAAAEAKAQFLANMSHEIRTPMNGVMGVLHLLKTEPLSGDGRKMLDDALNCGEMLAELLNDVIDFSKIEAGRLEMAEEPIEPRAVLEGVLRLLSPQADGKGLSLTIEADSDMGWVRSDPVRLRQALFNLVGNAVKFTAEGGVTVRCAIEDRPAGAVLRFEVADTGVGIPDEVQPRIFQRFDQGDASTTRRFGGSGLGLAITKALAEMMGGDVGFTSTAGEGSTFWLEVAAERTTALAAPAETEGAFLDGLRILVVEDNATNRMIATKLLENLGAAVETAADGLLGVEAAARGGFDLILMDVQMPGIDGPEAARRIRRMEGPVSQTPIVALTANVLAHQAKAYLEAGMNGVVGKPISPAALLAEISRLSGPGPSAEAAA